RAPGHATGSEGVHRRNLYDAAPSRVLARGARRSVKKNYRFGRQPGCRGRIARLVVELRVESPDRIAGHVRTDFRAEVRLATPALIRLEMLLRVPDLVEQHPSGIVLVDQNREVLAAFEGARVGRRLLHDG